jgi:hypothetical protein
LSAIIPVQLWKFYGIPLGPEQIVSLEELLMSQATPQEVLIRLLGNG